MTMLSKRVPRPTEKAQAIHEDQQRKRMTNDGDTTSEHNKRSRLDTSVRSPQSSFNSATGTNSDSTPWPTNHESATENTLAFAEHDHAIEINSDGDKNGEEQGETSKAEMGKHNDTGQ